MQGTAKNDLTDQLNLRLPIIQGPFGGGLSTQELTTAVSALGGLGSYGAHHLDPQSIAQLGRDLRQSGCERYAINLWVSNHDADSMNPSTEMLDRTWQQFEPYFRELGLTQPEWPTRIGFSFEEQIEALLEAQPPVFSFVFGVPSSKILQACRTRHIFTIGAATTIAEAHALEAAGVDAIVASGFEAGGHRPSFLASAEQSLTGTFALTQLISARVKCPVIAAGGIADANGVRAALCLGAQAAQMGTAFLACEESAAPKMHRDLLFSAHAEHTTLTRAFSGRLARGLRNRWTENWQTSDAIPAPYPLQGWFAAQMRSAAIANDQHDLISLWSGQIAPNLKHRRVATLMQELSTTLE